MTDQQAPAQTEAEISALFQAQKQAFARDPFPDRAARLERLQRLDQLLADHKEALIAAIEADFGGRARSETLLAEILGSHGAVHYAKRNLRRWMRPERRRTSLWSQPARSYVQAQPLGVVGIMSPWNYPLHLAIAPLVAALAAGNRAMVCMSEEAPALCALLAHLVAEIFPPDLISVVQGGSVSPAFAALPFDHLLFTGSTRVGRLIAQAAAANLTPVTLELGGKSPAVIGPDYDPAEAAVRLAWAKCFNAGQTCIAPDYVFVPRAKRDAFVQAVQDKFSRSYNGLSDKEYTSIVADRFHARLDDLLAEAQEAGARVLRPDGTPVPGKLPLTLVLDPPADTRLMREEIFGPILPVLSYDSLDEVIAHITAGDRPLAAYVFSHDKATVARIRRETVSGSLGVNEALMQYQQEDLPFGGVGASGQGAYHGREGFQTFSHMKSVFVQRGVGRFTGVKLLHPPHGRLARAVLRIMGG